MSSTTTTTMRTLEVLRRDGWTVDVVERWLPHTFTRRDLFGMFDIIAVRGAETLAVQTTSASNVSARMRKIADSPNVAAVRAAGWRLEVWGWRKNTKTGRWEHNVRDVS